MLALHPSLIAGDLLNLQKQIAELDAYCDGYHLDIMDFHFVPNITWGPDFINAIARATQKPLYIHLMVDDPEAYFALFKLRPDDTVAFHIESCLTTPAGCSPLTAAICPSAIDYGYIQELLVLLQKDMLKAAVALRPSTNITVLEPLLTRANNILLMSVEPGFSGQEFLPGSFGRLTELVQLRSQKEASCTITMDGGINKSNIKELAQKGVAACVLGSSVFKDHEPVRNLIELKELFKE